MARFKIDAKTGKTLTLDEKTGEWKPDRSRAKSRLDLNKAVVIMKDIDEFVSYAGPKPELITSRSQLGRHERSNNMRQAGDFKPGEVVAREKKRVEGPMEAARRAGGVSVEWV